MAKPNQVTLLWGQESLKLVDNRIRKVKGSNPALGITIPRSLIFDYFILIKASSKPLSTSIVNFNVVDGIVDVIVDVVVDFDVMPQFL